MEALASRQRRRQQRMLLVDALARVPGHALGKMPEGVLSQAWDFVALHGRLSEPLDPDLAGPVGADLDDLIIVEPGPDGVEGAINEDRQASCQRVHA